VSEDLALFEDRSGKAAIVVSPANPVRGDDSTHQEAWLVAAPESAIEVQLEPVINAGFRVVRVVTPSLALVALARRQREDVAGAVAYVALATHATVVAVVRSGALMLSRELSWGFGDDDGGDNPVPPRLGSELRRTLLYFRQAFRTPVEAVVLCGEMAGLRSLTTPLGDALGVPVQTLDSLAGVDIEHLPEPAETFRGQVAAFRVALAAGAEPEPFPSLRPLAAVWTRTRVAMVAAAACLGVAVLVGTLWRLNRPPAEGARPDRPAPVASPSTQAAAPAPAREANLPPQIPEGGKPQAPPQATAPQVSVTSILFSANRRLAIVDGRVVGIGDRVGSNTVFDIQPRAVVMESADGRRWTVELSVEAR